MLVQIAKEELDGSIQAFLSSKFEVVARISESRNVINKELLELARHNFDSVLKALNRCHTIWRCIGIKRNMDARNCYTKSTHHHD